MVRVKSRSRKVIVSTVCNTVFFWYCRCSVTNILRTCDRPYTLTTTDAALERLDTALRKCSVDVSGGAVIDVHWFNRGQWFTGTVLECNRDDSIHVVYDDGEHHWHTLQPRGLQSRNLTKKQRAAAASGLNWIAARDLTLRQMNHATKRRNEWIRCHRDPSGDSETPQQHEFLRSKGRENQRDIRIQRALQHDEFEILEKKKSTPLKHRVTRRKCNGFGCESTDTPVQPCSLCGARLLCSRCNTRLSNAVMVSVSWPALSTEDRNLNATNDEIGEESIALREMVDTGIADFTALAGQLFALVKQTGQRGYQEEDIAECLAFRDRVDACELFCNPVCLFVSFFSSIVFITGGLALSKLSTQARQLLHKFGACFHCIARSDVLMSAHTRCGVRCGQFRGRDETHAYNRLLIMQELVNVRKDVRVAKREHIEQYRKCCREAMRNAVAVYGVHAPPAVEELLQSARVSGCADVQTGKADDIQISEGILLSDVVASHEFPVGTRFAYLRSDDINVMLPAGALHTNIISWRYLGAFLPKIISVVIFRYLPTARDTAAEPVELMPSTIESVLLVIAPTCPLYRISKGSAVNADDDVVEDIAVVPVDRMASCAGIGAVLVVHAGFVATAGPDASLPGEVEKPCIILSMFGEITIGACASNIYIYIFIYYYYYKKNRLIHYFISN